MPEATTFPRISEALVGEVKERTRRLYREAVAEWGNPTVTVPDFREYEGARLVNYGCIFSLSEVEGRQPSHVAADLVGTLLVWEAGMLQGAAGSGDRSRITRVLLDGYPEPMVVALRGPGDYDLYEEDGIRIRHQLATRGGVG